MSDTNMLPQEIIEKAVTKLNSQSIDNKLPFLQILQILSDKGVKKACLIVTEEMWKNLINNENYYSYIDSAVSQEMKDKGFLGYLIGFTTLFHVLCSTAKSTENKIQSPLIYLSQSEDLYVLKNLYFLDNEKRITSIKIGDREWQPSQENLESVEKVFEKMASVTEITTNDSDINLKEINLNSIESVDSFRQKQPTYENITNSLEENQLSQDTASEISNNNIKNTLSSLKEIMQTDDMYAWSWHCNIAMPIMDDLNVSHRQANETAARLMKHLFNIDITKNEMYIDLMKRLEANNE